MRAVSASGRIAPLRARGSIALLRLGSLVCALAIFWTLPAPRAAALPIVSHHGRWLTDPQGRVVILHGVQIDKYEPTAPVEHIDLSAANVRFIAAEGFNVARVSLAYAGVEPRIGHFDDSYIRQYTAFDRQLASAGVYDLIDMMQGQFSIAIGGWGFPDWMALTNGAPNNRAPFSIGYYNNRAEEAVWDNLWANKPAGDGTGLQDHYSRGLHRIARAFTGSPGLLALEILNEPWPGSPWPTCVGAAGCPPGGFDQTSLTSFYRRVIPSIRTADSRHLIAYEPNLLFGFPSPTRLGALGDRNLLFAFHSYCLASAPGLPPNPALAASCPTIENNTLDNAETRAQDRGGALLMDEWGNTTDLTQVDRITREADQHMVGWTVWAYEDCCNSPAAIIKNGTKPPTAPGNLNLVELNALARPYPELVSGTPTSWSYDPTSDAFSLTYSTRPVAGGRFSPDVDTQIELPALHYPTGYIARVTGATVLSAPDANLLRLGNQPGARTVRVTVTPAPHHPGAPGPFVWPRTATGTESADCPAQAAHAIQIRSRRRGVPIVRVLVYVDGRHVATARAPRVRRIELPAGLADGSVVRLVASTARGQQLTASRRVHGCSPTPAGAWADG